MKQFTNISIHNGSGQGEINADRCSWVKIHDQRMRLWAARSMAFP